MTPTEPQSIEWVEKGEEVGSETQLTSGETIRRENRAALLQSGAKNGQKWAPLDMSNVSGYPTTLDDASGTVTWAFNMRQNRSDPEGFSSGEHGLMFVLAGSSNDFPGSANSYAIVLGQDGPTDNLKLVSFNGGFNKEGDFAEIVTWSQDLDTQFLSVRVTFDADTKIWTLYAQQNANGYPQSDPRNVPESAKRGSTQNSDLTGDGQKYLGLLWNHGQDDAAKAFFDDVYVTDPNRELPVELTGFTAQSEARDVHLRWTTVSETGNAGFEVQRRRGDSFDTIGFVEGAGTTSQAREYSYTVQGLSPGRHTFRLKQVDLNGGSSLSSKQTVLVRPKGLHLSPRGPNPVQKGQTANFTVAAERQQSVSVTLHDIMGRTVQTVYQGTVGARGRTLSVSTDFLAQGTYFLRVQGRATATHRITVLP